MADITKCKGENCDKKEQCYRYTAKANEFRQSYFTQTPKSENCEYFIKNKYEIKIYNTNSKNN